MGSTWPKKGLEGFTDATSNRSDLLPEEETTLSIGRFNPSLYVVPLRRTHSGRVDSADGNWVDARVTIRAGKFEGDFVACLRSDEIQMFLDEVQEMRAGTRPTARYRSLEGWLSIDLTQEKHDRFIANCAARDDLGSTNRLQWSVTTDRADLEELASSLEGWLRHLPVVGAND